jgi:hypothetical protein
MLQRVENKETAGRRLKRNQSLNTGVNGNTIQFEVSHSTLSQQQGFSAKYFLAPIREHLLPWEQGWHILRGISMV